MTSPNRKTTSRTATPTSQKEIRNAKKETEQTHTHYVTTRNNLLEICRKYQFPIKKEQENEIVQAFMDWSITHPVSGYWSKFYVDTWRFFHPGKNVNEKSEGDK